MKFILHLLLLTALLMLFYTGTNAQDITPGIHPKDSASKKESYFKLNGNYLSNAIYSGRGDSAAVPYMRSSIGYYDKSGFHIDAGASLLLNATDTKRIDLITLEAGYAFKISKKMEGEISASKFFYTDASYAVTSELQAITGADVGYDLGPVSLNAGAELLFSSNTDIATGFKVAHYFEKWPVQKRWTVSPAIELNAGTQYFNEAYYKNRKFTFTTSGSPGNNGNGHPRRGHSNSGNSGSNSTIIKTLVFHTKNKFTLLDYEFSLPITYETRRWCLYTTPVFAIPVNPATYAVDGVLRKENLSNRFFIEIGAYVKFYTRKKV